MVNNVGIFDRVARILVGVALIAYAIPVGFPYTGWNWIGWLGVIPLATAAAGNCPAYSLFGFSTRKKRDRNTIRYADESANAGPLAGRRS